jgi:hypothetical protein
MTASKLHIKLPNSTDRATSIYTATHNYFVWSVEIARGDAVINQDIGVQTGGVFMWSVGNVTVTDPSIRVSWQVENASGQVMRGPFEGREGDDIYLSIQTYYMIPMQKTGTRCVCHSPIKSIMNGIMDRTGDSGFVVVSAACPSCKRFFKVLPALHERGYRIIALDDKLTYCIRDLLCALQVTSLPAVVDDTRKVHCGQDAFVWGNSHAELSFEHDDMTQRGTSIDELLTLLAEKHMRQRNVN